MTQGDTSGNIKNVDFRNVKSRKVINLAREFSDAANKLISSIRSPLEIELLKELENIELAPKINNSLKIHKWSRNVAANGETTLYFLGHKKIKNLPFLTVGIRKKI